MMRGKKNMIFRNALGQEVVFDNRTLFLESIDMIGAPGIHAAESLAGADGQQTICHQLGPKTIPCGLALKAVGDVEWLKNRLSEVFFPGHGNAGTMTVVTQYGRYEIECYPANVPSFTMAENDGAYRFNVDFVADYPYWRKGAKQSITFTRGAVNSYYIQSRCPYEICPDIYLPASSSDTQMTIVASDVVGGPTLSFLAHDFPIILSTRKFDMRNANTGALCTNYLNPNVPVDDLRIRYGKNFVKVLSGVQDGIVVSWYELSMGEI